ncbi:hypothetical protein [Chryseobacterium sp. 'Rf worker isolate 10']|uniref:hypothetical protein n=1 Tax=Chryseobacterium sp. 'Rf worker isolate 10' TaxID=2887348 RepID=UPI003D6E6A1B
MKAHKSYWRYQVINRGTEDEPSFGIHEIYFNIKKNGDNVWTENPENLGEYDNLEELIGSLEMMLKDAKKYSPLLESEMEKKLK